MKRGDWLVHEGEPTNSLFFVVRGQVEAVKHCSLIQAERWPAGAHTWEVTKTQRVKAYPVGRLGEGEVVGVEGVCGVGTRDFSVRVVSATCVVYVVKRVAFAGWSGMKKVMRDCQNRMMEWRERAAQQVQLQAEGKHNKHKAQPWQQHQPNDETDYIKHSTDDATDAAASGPQEQPSEHQEEEKVQLESDRSHQPAHQQPAPPRLSRGQSTAQSRMSTHSHRQAPVTEQRTAHSGRRQQWRGGRGAGGREAAAAQAAEGGRGGSSAAWHTAQRGLLARPRPHRRAHARRQSTTTQARSQPTQRTTKQSSPASGSIKTSSWWRRCD